MIDDFDLLRKENMRYYGFGPEVMARQKVCKACHEINDADRENCMFCGAVLLSATLYDVYRLFHPHCPACQTIVSASNNYCPACGKRLKKRYPSRL